MDRIKMKKYLSNVVYKLVRGIESVICWGVLKVGHQKTNIFLNDLCEIIEHYSDEFIQYVSYPQKTEAIVTESILWRAGEREIPKTAILLTGLLKMDKDFLYETVEYYKRMYPKSEIILSTWNDQDPSYLSRIRGCGVHVIVDDQPQIMGVGHINNQLVASYNGIMYAQKLGCYYVLKTRTDTRIYRRNILNYLYDCLKKYPSTSNSQHSRLLTMSGRYGTANHEYLLCDFISFGYIEDMKALYSIKRDVRTNYDMNITYEQKIRQRVIPEVYLYKGYLDEKIDERNFEYTKQDYYEALRDYFIILDESFFQIYWYEYHERFDWLRGNGFECYEEINVDSVSWESLYQCKEKETMNLERENL